MKQFFIKYERIRLFYFVRVPNTKSMYITVKHLDEIEKMNMFPQSHFYSLLHQHYHSVRLLIHY